MDSICFNSGKPLCGSWCAWCTCEQCGHGFYDGVCVNCDTQKSINNLSNILNYHSTPPQPQPSSFNCYNCGNPSEAGVPCGQCFCNQCGYANCMCYAPSAETSYNTSFDNYPQNDFNPSYQNSFEQRPYVNNEPFHNSPNQQQKQN